MVRKRLVKLLRDLYFKFFDPEIKIDIASKLILRIGDNEIVISQLALKITQEILFQPFEDIEKEGNDYFGYSYANSPKERKRKINELTKVITGAVSKLDPSITAQNAALSQIIRKVLFNFILFFMLLIVKNNRQLILLMKNQKFGMKKSFNGLLILFSIA